MEPINLLEASICITLSQLHIDLLIRTLTKWSPEWKPMCVMGTIIGWSWTNKSQMIDFVIVPLICPISLYTKELRKPSFVPLMTSSSQSNLSFLMPRTNHQ